MLRSKVAVTGLVLLFVIISSWAVASKKDSKRSWYNKERAAERSCQEKLGLQTPRKISCPAKPNLHYLLPTSQPTFPLKLDIDRDCVPDCIQNRNGSLMACDDKNDNTGNPFICKIYSVPLTALATTVIIGADLCPFLEGHQIIDSDNNGVGDACDCKNDYDGDGWNEDYPKYEDLPQSGSVRYIDVNENGTYEYDTDLRAIYLDFSDYSDVPNQMKFYKDENGNAYDNEILIPVHHYFRCDRCTATSNDFGYYGPSLQNKCGGTATSASDKDPCENEKIGLGEWDMKAPGCCANSYMTTYCPLGDKVKYETSMPYYELIPWSDADTDGDCIPNCVYANGIPGGNIPCDDQDDNGLPYQCDE